MLLEWFIGVCMFLVVLVISLGMENYCGVDRLNCCVYFSVSVLNLVCVLVVWWWLNSIS